jgi:hypothetical protein
MISTGIAKYRMRILFAIKLVRLPKPTVAIVNGVLGVSWRRGDLFAMIIQNIKRPSQFDCQTFIDFKKNSSTIIELEALDGPVRLLEFLDAVADWLA